MNDTYDTKWKQEIYELIQQARNENKWLWCHYHNLWFSPDQLEEANRQGKFLWGSVNWKIRDPIEYLAEVETRVRNTVIERDHIRNRIILHEILSHNRRAT